uniref:Uncharacterized protein n=1 Tax=Anguilla anguilla TaxID=7936 RepID=A0A0E9WJT4_ANGAN
MSCLPLIGFGCHLQECGTPGKQADLGPKSICATYKKDIISKKFPEQEQLPQAMGGK